MSGRSTVKRQQVERPVATRPVSLASSDWPRPLSRLTAVLGSGAVQAVLIMVALIWITPLAGLFLSSLRSEQDNASEGWWTALPDPSQLSLDNYTALFEDSGIGEAFWNTVLISVPTT